MIKSIFLTFLFVFVPVCGYTDSPTGPGIPPIGRRFKADFYTKFHWSYGALADTIKEMVRSCRYADTPDLTPVGDWMRENGDYFSVNEIMFKLESSGVFKKGIVRGSTNSNGAVFNCELPGTCNEDKSNCGEEGYFPQADAHNKALDIFLSTFRKHTNERAAYVNNPDRQPGTYVKKVTFGSADSFVNPLVEVWKIEDVILAPDYWRTVATYRYEVNRDANENPENTWIYVINDDNTITRTNLHTWTNDMFMDIEATADAEGRVRGAFVNSYIWPKEDLTRQIYSLYDEYRGKLKSSVKKAIKSRQHGPYDIKYNYRDRFKISGQRGNEPDTNGVLFDGKIAHLDWLGHFLFGMNRNETIASGGTANWAAQELSHIDSGNTEPLHMQSAWDIGDDYIETNKYKRNNHFSETYTTFSKQAENTAKEYVQKIVSGIVGDVSCDGNCGWDPTVPDVVVCTYATKYKSYNRIEFNFKAICGRKTLNVAGFELFEESGRAISEQAQYIGSIPGMK